jgi:hypothetical protein
MINTRTKYSGKKYTILLRRWNFVYGPLVLWTQDHLREILRFVVKPM